MNKITEITKRDIVDILVNGFVGTETVVAYDYYEHQYEKEQSVKYIINMYGRLNELDFLSRIYDLDSMESYDSRFKNAKGDIIQHTINNDDWEENWVLSDERFGILNGGDDNTFLNFVCEIFHPVVRIESQPWKKILEKINELIQYDGYVIYVKEQISGRDVYGWKEINSVEIDTNTHKDNYKMDLIGEGSYAFVYKYKDDFYNEYFVVKRAKKNLNDKEIERFKQEYNQLRQLSSPYIIKVYNYNDVRNEYIMELMNISLDEYIRKNNGNLSVKERKNIVYQVLRAFKYIHSKGLLHRDISPKNILLKIYDDVKIVKISDFGLVKIPESQLTSENTEFKGYFNDPSLQLDGFASYSMLHETYAITRLIFFIMTGKTNTDRIDNVELKEFVRRGINSDKGKRYKNVEEVENSFISIKNI